MSLFFCFFFFSELRDSLVTVVPAAARLWPPRTGLRLFPSGGPPSESRPQRLVGPPPMESPGRRGRSLCAGRIASGDDRRAWRRPPRARGGARADAPYRESQCCRPGTRPGAPGRAGERGRPAGSAWSGRPRWLAAVGRASAPAVHPLRRGAGGAGGARPGSGAAAAPPPAPGMGLCKKRATAPARRPRPPAAARHRAAPPPPPVTPPAGRTCRGRGRHCRWGAHVGASG